VRQAASRTGNLGEPLAVYAFLIGLVAALFWLGRSVPWINEFSPAFIASGFIFGPQIAGRWSGRPFNSEQMGLVFQPWPKFTRLILLTMLLTWPLYTAGFFLFYSGTCPLDAPLHHMQPLLHPMCHAWKGWGTFRLVVPDGFLITALSQVILVAFPEEIFFRGYLLSRLEERWPSHFRFWGANIGWSLIVSSMLFGIGHMLVDLNPARLAVILPGFIFGYLRLRSGSVAPGAMFHALCNLFAELLHESYF
jgi:membrane protease YdiL (CAAX protease family)